MFSYTTIFLVVSEIDKKNRVDMIDDTVQKIF